MTTNTGGYASFFADISTFIHFGRSNELLVFVYDPTDSEEIVIPIGKQTLRMLAVSVPFCRLSYLRTEPLLLYALQRHLAECLD